MIALFKHFFAAGGRSLAVVCLTLAGVLGAANYFLWKQRLVLAEEHETVRRKGEGILTALVDRPRINADLARLQDALAVIDGDLVVESEMEVNLGYFYKLEKQSQVKLAQLSQLSSPPSPEGNPFRLIPISLRATGTYPQLMDFIHRLETGPRILAIRVFSFSRDPKTGAMSLEITLDMLGKP